MGFDEEVREETISTIEHYVCTIYGKPKLKSVNEPRLDIFLKKYKSKSKDEVINCVRKLDGSSLPPCFRILWQKVLPTNYRSNEINPDSGKKVKNKNCLQNTYLKNHSLKINKSARTF